MISPCIATYAVAAVCGVFGLAAVLNDIKKEKTFGPYSYPLIGDAIIHGFYPPEDKSLLLEKLQERAISQDATVRVMSNDFSERVWGEDEWGKRTPWVEFLSEHLRHGGAVKAFGFVDNYHRGLANLVSGGMQLFAVLEREGGELYLSVDKPRRLLTEWPGQDFDSRRNLIVYTERPYADAWEAIASDFSKLESKSSPYRAPVLS